MTRELVTVDDDATAALWHRVDAVVHDADFEGLPADPVGEILPTIRMHDAGDRVEMYVALDADEPVASGRIDLPLRDNLAAATVDVQVVPHRRREGFATAMYEHLLGRARAHGRTRIFGEVPGPLDPSGASPARGLAERFGARRVLTEIRRLLDVGMASEQCDRLLAETAKAATADGYSLLQWLDHAPEDCYDDMARLESRMTIDPPMGEMEWEPEEWDAERIRAAEEISVARGRRRLVSAVRDERSGRLAGFTDVGVNASRPYVAYQWDTIVAPEHRGHRLGLWLKTANLRLLRQEIPAARLVNTWNAESNAHMIAINEAMGFRVVDRWCEYQLDL